MAKLQISLGFLFLALMGYGLGEIDLQPHLQINELEIQKLGKLIWHNECNGQKAGLTSWNEGEEFISLGIGHFIWYPTGQTGPFKEKFPELLIFLQKKGISPPSFLNNQVGCPWKNREAFKCAYQGSEMAELREWLYHHVEMQALFMVESLQKDFPLLIKSLPLDKQKKISTQFTRMTLSPGGLYALIDYLNFKGAGASKIESYCGCNWGLIQVLETLQGTSTDVATIKEFINAAKSVLNQRILLAPPERKESRWRAGWFNRLDSYIKYAKEDPKNL